MVAVAQCLDRGLDDEVRRAEVGLADAEIDDVAALRDERVGAREHREGVLLADAIEGCDGAEHDLYARRTIAGVSCLIVGAPTCCIMP